MINLWIGQGISILVLIGAVVIAQLKNLRHILLGEVLLNVLTALSFLFLGGLSGAWICIAAAVQTVLLYQIDQGKCQKLSKKTLTVLFCFIYILGTALVYRGWNDIVSCLCAILYSLAVAQKNAGNLRWYMIANSTLWLIYDLTVFAVVNIITHAMSLISLITAKIRLDRKPKTDRP